MKTPEIPANELLRLERLWQLDLLDTGPEEVLDGITRLAAILTGMPVALLSIVDADRQWFKSAVGFPQGGQTPRAISFCAHAIGAEGVFEVEDARTDPRFCGNPLVQAPDPVIHYVGVPLVLPGGVAIGTLCVAAGVPGRLDDAQRTGLVALAEHVVQVLLLRERERQQAVQRRAAMEHLERAIEASGLGLWEYDLRSGEVILSARAARLAGLPAQERRLCAGEAARSFLPQGSTRLVRAMRRLLRGTVDRVSVEHRVRHPAAGAGWLLTAAKVLERGPDGQPTRVVGTSQDISERRDADARLRAALAAADSASRAKSDFLATMSHEIRTPLNGVIGLAQLLAGAHLPPTESDAVAMIDSCAKSLLSLVDNILDFSKIEAGLLTLQEAPTDLPALVAEVGDLFTVRANDKGLRFELFREAAVPRWIVADPGRLRQILLNLLGNALKFTARGGFALRIACEADGEGDEVLHVQVSDTGPGISAADQERLFARFTRVGDAPARNLPGTGLGLAISRELAERMGGSLAVRSRSGEGAVFTLSLPLRRAAAPHAGEAPESLPRREDVSILVVEDNEVNRLVARRVLARLGYASVACVDDGLQALQACERAVFDLILMDCQMPVMDGLSAARELRRRGHRTPIIAFTASATVEDRERCLAAGMDDFLLKPVEIAVLSGKLERWLPRGQGSKRPLSHAATPGEAQVFASGVVESHFLGDRALYRRARAIFLDQASAGLDGLRAGATPADVAALMHRTRGAAATLGAERLVAVCMDWERASDSLADHAAHRHAVLAALADFTQASEGVAEADRA